MKVLVALAVFASIIATDIAPAFAGYEPPATIGAPKRTRGSGGR